MNDLKNVIDSIDLGLPAPLEEPERQYYFIRKGREYVTARSKSLGRDLTCHRGTFRAEGVQDGKDAQDRAFGYEAEPEGQTSGR